MQARFQRAASRPRPQVHPCAEAGRGSSGRRQISGVPPQLLEGALQHSGGGAAQRDDLRLEQGNGKSVNRQNSPGSFAMYDDLSSQPGVAAFDTSRAVRSMNADARMASGRRSLAAWRPFARVGFTAFAATFVWSACAWAHDWRRPDLDDWYGGLKRPNVAASPQSQSTSCCSSKDCHVTQAELRGGDWWARVGKPRSDGDWDLLDWVRVPSDVVLQQHDNPTGEGVICHSLDWTGNKLNASLITIWCFVPPIES
jgi:hypothetical protein